MTSNSAGLRSIRAAIVSGALLSLGGCGQILPPPHLYVLSSEVTPTASMPATRRPVSIGVSPTSLPEYLDRSEIVVRDGPNELRLVETDRWAERLSINISRVVAGNLATLLPSASLVILPTRNAEAADLEVSLDLIAFESDSQGNCTISGRWIITDLRRRVELANGKVAVNEPAGGNGYAAVAAAMSRGLAKVSGDIATAINAAPARPKASPLAAKETQGWSRA
jgi:uncharacterized lipoprotein YmbA